MSVEKSELKAAFAHSLGCDSDDDLEAAQRDVLRFTGRIQAAVIMESQITKIITKLKSDMDSDSPPFQTTEDYMKARHYLGACLAQAATLSKQSDNLRLQMEGKVMAFKHTIKRLTKIKTDEENKAKAVKAIQVISQTDIRHRPLGVHPGPSIAAQRKEETLKANGNGTTIKRVVKKRPAAKRKVVKKVEKKTKKRR